MVDKEQVLKEIERRYLSLPGTKDMDDLKKIREVLEENSDTEAAQFILDEGGTTVVLMALACSYAERLKQKNR